MRLLWEIEEADVIRVKEFYDEHKDNGFVYYRFRRNVERDLPELSRDLLWKSMVACLLTTQQRSGPKSAVSRFMGSKPFLLSYEQCKQAQEEGSLRQFAESILSRFGGIRRSPTLAGQVQDNFIWLESSGWSNVDSVVRELNESQTHESEVEAADFIDDNLKGFGPKQARNLLQLLGLTKYEIPIESRITKWLNDFGFPVRLSAVSLADRNYYVFVSEGFRKLCAASDLYSCMLDAAIFSSFDN